jgi:hypothetical protein
MMTEIETALAGIRKMVDDLRGERDLYRKGLEAIVAGETEDAKLVALLYLGRIIVTCDRP